jgi:hypothetical protein
MGFPRQSTTTNHKPGSLPFASFVMANGSKALGYRPAYGGNRARLNQKPGSFYQTNGFALKSMEGPSTLGAVGHG